MPKLSRLPNFRPLAQTELAPVLVHKLKGKIRNGSLMSSRKVFNFQLELAVFLVVYLC